VGDASPLSNKVGDAGPSVPAPLHPWTVTCTHRALGHSARLFLRADNFETVSGKKGGSVAEWLACWTQAQ